MIILHWHLFIAVLGHLPLLLLSVLGLICRILGQAGNLLIEYVCRRIRNDILRAYLK